MTSNPREALSGIVSRLKELRTAASSCTPPLPLANAADGSIEERRMLQVNVADLTLCFVSNASGEYFSISNNAHARLMAGYYDAAGPDCVIAGRRISGSNRILDDVHVIGWSRGAWEERPLVADARPHSLAPAG
jgi:hypothetical protein